MQNKSIRYCLIFFVVLSLNSFAYAKDKHEKDTHKLRIVNATVNLDNDILYINGENFGKDTEIWLDDDILNIQFKSDDYIEADLPDDIEAGTYRLVVDGKKKKSKHHLFPILKFIVPHAHMDMIDITIGVVGSQGPRGEKGLQGPAGIAGSIGPQGPRGERGLQGSAGLKGEKGDTGSQGIAGSIGPQGPRGEKGLRGPTGIKGDKGDTGSQGIAGPIGPQGPRGEMGLQGPAGIKGDKGDTGSQGIAGPIGPQGPRGERGLQGPAGIKGDKGDTGTQGIAGSIGPQGPRGEKGLQGPAGIKGDKGDTGSQGIAGSVGSQGPKGDKGDKGDPGISGYGIVSKTANATLLSFGGSATVLSVSCPSGKKVLGGGGKSDYNGDLLSESYPMTGGSGWTIKYTNQSAYTRKISLTVYAICAECQ